MRRRSLRIPLATLLAACLAILAACGDDDSSDGERATEPAPAAWGYEGRLGPDRWAELSPE
jgi:carbonic anhydrase